MLKPLKEFIGLIEETIDEWQEDNAMRLAAALSYYTVFSLAPLLLAAIAIAGLVFGHEAATGKIYDQLHQFVGTSVAQSMQEVVQAADKPSSGFNAAVIGFMLGLFGASAVFGELIDSLNHIWGVKQKKGRGIIRWVIGRLFSIGMVMGVCLLLLASIVLNTVLGAITEYGLGEKVEQALIGQSISFVISIGFTTLLFSALFKFLPKTKILWSDVWTGGALTALLFTLGKFGLEQYLARSNPGSGYGAAGALAVILIWVYYSAQIFFFGAEFTRVYARRFGSYKGRSDN